MTLSGYILQVTPWQVLFYPAGGGTARWLPRAEITLRDEAGEPLTAEAAAASKELVQLRLPGWLARREGLSPAKKVKR